MIGLGEAAVKRQAFALLRALNCRVYSLSQSRPSRIALGVPDAYVFPPFGKPSFWYEAKADGGKQSPDQVQFQVSCERCGAAYILGGRAEVEAHLRRIGML